MSWREVFLGVVLVLAAGCGRGGGNPVVAERWRVNPDNVEAFVESLHNVNSFASTDDSYYVAFSGVATGIRTTDVFLRRFDRASRQWDPTRRVSDGRGLSRAPSVVWMDNALWIVWVSDTTEAGGDIGVTVRRSGDRGKSWDEGHRFAVGNIRPRVPQVAVVDQTLLVAISNSFAGQPERVAVVSIPARGEPREHSLGAAGQRSTRPQLVATAGGTVYLSWFDTGGEGRTIQVSSSRDQGASWSEPAVINDSSRLMAREHCLCASEQGIVAAWAVLDGSQGRLLTDFSAPGGQSWGSDRVVFEDFVRVITPVCQNISDNRMLVAWSLVSNAAGELGMRILYDVFDAAAQAGGSGVQTERSLVGTPVVGQSYQKFDVAAAGSFYASAFAIRANRHQGIFVSSASDLENGFGEGVLVSEGRDGVDYISPRIGEIGDGTMSLLYNSRPTSSSSVVGKSRLGDLFLAAVELP